METQPAPSQSSYIPKPTDKSTKPRVHILWIPFLLSLLIFISILIGIGIIIGKTFFSTKVIPTPIPTSIPDPTSNWKTYTNSLYHFEMKYPWYWFTYSYQNDPEHNYNFDIATITQNQIINGILPENQAKISMNIVYASPSIPINQWIIPHPALGKEVIATSSSTLDHETIYNVIYKEVNQNIQGKIVYIPLNITENQSETFLEIDLNYHKDDPKEIEYNQIFNQILSTFKFIEPTANNYSLSGGFKNTITDSDTNDFNSKIQSLGVETMILTMFPPRFSISDMTQEKCTLVRNSLSSLAYLSDLSLCRQETSSPGQSPGGLPNQ